MQNLSQSGSDYKMQGPASQGFTVYQAIHHAVKRVRGEPWTDYAAISYRSPSTPLLGTGFYLPTQ